MCGHRNHQKKTLQTAGLTQGSMRRRRLELDVQQYRFAFRDQCGRHRYDDCYAYHCAHCNLASVVIVGRNQ